MVNQQLLDYIKQQLQQGVSREQIKSFLMANGWQTQDIEEGFNTINSSTPIEQYSNFPTKAPMKMWKIIFVVFIGVILIGSGVYFVAQKFLKPNEKFQLNLDIITPKDSYKVGEQFTGGKYLLTYNGDPFQAIVLYAKSRKGFEKVAYDKAVGTIKTGDFDSNPGLREAHNTGLLLNSNKNCNWPDLYILHSWPPKKSTYLPFLAVLLAEKR